MSRRALICVSHLLGTGHLVRAGLIARALAARGVDTTLASGGMPVPGFAIAPARFVQLPPVRAEDARFARLLDGDGGEADANLFEARHRRLLRTFHDTAPQVVVVEHYPFGRRKLAGEFRALLAAAREAAPRAVTVGSVRDILTERSDPARIEAMTMSARTELDAVLVHGDSRVVPFAASFPAADVLADRLIHTGYVCAGPEPSVAEGAGTGEVIVSAGGGAVGEAMLGAALAAAALDDARTWRILIGPALARAGVERLGGAAPGNAIVEPNRADFRHLLANCAVSVSQAGYNTIADVLAARARAVVVPFSADGQTEQTMRARRMASLGLFDVIEENALSTVRLAAAVVRAAMAPRPAPGMVDLGGAARSARILETWAGLGHADVERADR